MVFTVSKRTDIPNYYWKWFLNRLKEGYVMVRNPQYPEKVSKYGLTEEDIDGFMFLSKNYAPTLSTIGEIASKYRTQFSYTITSYGEDVEANVPKISESIKTYIELAKIVGKERMAWRFDPIAIYGKYDVKYHLLMFETIASYIAPYTEWTGFNFVNMYEKVYRNMAGCRPPNDDERLVLLRGMSDIAKKYGLKVQSCMTNMDQYGFYKGPCSTLSMLGDGWKNLKYKDECLMCGKLETRDVGIYHTCPNACKYCYANAYPEVAAQKLQKFDMYSPMLLDQLNGDEMISEAKQRRYAA